MNIVILDLKGACVTLYPISQSIMLDFISSVYNFQKIIGHIHIIWWKNKISNLIWYYLSFWCPTTNEFEWDNKNLYFDVSKYTPKFEVTFYFCKVQWLKKWTVHSTNSNWFVKAMYYQSKQFGSSVY